MKRILATLLSVLSLQATHADEHWNRFRGPLGNGKAHYDVYSGECLDDVMKLEIPWFDKYLKKED